MSPWLSFGWMLKGKLFYSAYISSLSVLVTLRWVSETTSYTVKSSLISFSEITHPSFTSFVKSVPSPLIVRFNYNSLTFCKKRQEEEEEKKYTHRFYLYYSA
jgi:hypothetical protein